MEHYFLVPLPLTTQMGVLVGFVLTFLQYSALGRKEDLTTSFIGPANSGALWFWLALFFQDVVVLIVIWPTTPFKTSPSFLPSNSILRMSILPVT